MRGNVVVSQPIVNDTLAFAWNGEVFRCPNLELRSDSNDSQLLFDAVSNCWYVYYTSHSLAKYKDKDYFCDRNDADLEPTSTSTTTPSRSLRRLSSLLYSIEGPFAFVLYHRPSKTIYFGRDRLGRRSLLLNHCRSERADGFCLSSAATFRDVNDHVSSNNSSSTTIVTSLSSSSAISHWIELPPRGVYAISFQDPCMLVVN
jgi:asparagine synthetase B (glutamine-hydrolysing)